MRLLAVLTLPLLFLSLTGCTDQPTVPDMDLTASYARGGGGKPEKPPKPGDDPGDPLAFISIETSFRPLVGAFTCAVEDADSDGVGPVRLRDRGL